jgi:hypothetical protein
MNLKRLIAGISPRLEESTQDPGLLALRKD